MLMKKKDLFIFMFHKISTDIDFLHMSIHPDKFDSIITWCNLYGDIISLNDLESSAWNSTTFCITFDDGYKNNLSFVKSHPEEKAIIYLATSYIGTGKSFWADKMQSLILKSRLTQIDLTKYKLGKYKLNTIKSKKRTILKLNMALKQFHPHKIDEIVNEISKQLRNDKQIDDVFLSWNDVVYLNDQHVDIGSHTHNHVITNKVNKKELEFEFKKSNSLISEHIKKPVIHFAYPNGTINDIFNDYELTLKKFGYKTAVTTVDGSNKKNCNPFLLKRINITENRITNPLGFPSKAMFTTLLTNPFGIH